MVSFLRRARNRLAQRAVRERRTARLRHLEHQLAASQRSDADQLQQVLDENASLRDALCAARKKLFSVAASVTKLANDIAPLLGLDSDLVKTSPNHDHYSHHSRSFNLR